MSPFIVALMSGAISFSTFAPTPVVEPVKAEQAVPEAKPVVWEADESKTRNTVKNETTRVVTVTAYTSEPRQTDSTPCISSDGSNICNRYAKGELICAAGDRDVPLGSRFYVEGYGECSVADRMNIRYNGTGRVDIYLGYDTPSAFQWGLRKVAVTRIK